MITMLMVTGAALMIANDLSKLAIYALSLVHVDVPPDLQLVLVDLLTLTAAAAMAYLMPAATSMQSMMPIVPAVALIAALGAAPFLMAGTGVARQPAAAMAQLPAADEPEDDPFVRLPRTTDEEPPANAANAGDTNPISQPAFGSFEFCSQGDQPARAIERCLNWTASLRRPAR